MKTSHEGMVLQGHHCIKLRFYDESDSPDDTRLEEAFPELEEDS
jgi:hypothetical protein